MTRTLAETMSRIPDAFIPEKAAGVDAIVHFKFTGDEAGEWNAVIRNGTCVVAQGIPRLKPTITLTADSGDFGRIVSGELDGTKAFMEGRIRFSGDADSAIKLLGLFKTS